MGETLLDRVLVRPRERGKYEITRIGRPGMDIHARYAFVHFPYSVQVREVQIGMHALRVHVQGNSHYIKISGTLTIAEKSAFDSVSSSH